MKPNNQLGQKSTLRSPEAWLRQPPLPKALGFKTTEIILNKYILLLIIAITAMPALARDNIADYSFKEAMSIEKISSAIGSGIDFYFAGMKHPKIIQSFGEFQSNKKTNAFGKSDKKACQWAFASAMKALKDRAEKEGGNAVINIRSNYKGNLTSSSTTFQCGSGAVIAGVTLVGDVVKLSK